MYLPCIYACTNEFYFESILRKVYMNKIRPRLQYNPGRNYSHLLLSELLLKYMIKHFRDCKNLIFSRNRKEAFKGTVSAISSDLPWQCPWIKLKVYLNVEDIFVFLSLNVLNSYNSHVFLHWKYASHFFVERHAVKIFKTINVDIYTWSDKAFKGIGNRALPSLHGGSLKSMLKILLKLKIKQF